MATVQLTFYIHLTDQAQVLAYQALYPNGVIRGPQPAAVEFSAPYQERSDPFSAPCTRTAWHPKEASGKFLYDRAVFTLSNGGFFGFLGLSNTRYCWVGQFVYAAPSTPPTEGGGTSEIEAMPQRKWVKSFSLKSQGGSDQEGDGGSSLATQAGRFASRTVDGHGMAIRSQANSMQLNCDEFGAALNTRTWERLYVRLRRVPTVQTAFWKPTAAGGTGAEALKLYVLPSGQVAAYGVDNASAETLVGSTTAALVIDEWTKFDLMIEFKTLTASVVAKFKLYQNGTLVLSGSPTVRAAALAFTHGNTVMTASVAGTALELDVDDWIGAEMPGRFKADAWLGATTYAANDYALVGDIAYRSLVGANTNNAPASSPTFWIKSIGPVDFFTGSHVEISYPLAFTANHNPLWLGDVRLLQRTQQDGVNITPNELTTSTAGAILEVDMDARGVGLGAAAIAIAVHGSKAAGVDNTLGHGIGGAAPTMQTVVQDGTRDYDGVLFRPSGLTAPQTIHPLRLRLTKAATADANTVQGLVAAIEYIGNFGKEDFVADPSVSPALAIPEFPRRPGIHNAPYPRSPWATTSLPPHAGVLVKTGTYVGNGTGQDLSLGVGIHWIVIRPVTGPAGGAKWWSTMIQCGHPGLQGSPGMASIGLVSEDETFVTPGGAGDSEERYYVRLGGADSQLNTLATVYQYMVFSDPGARVLLNGAFYHGNNAADAAVANVLDDSGFIPEFGLFWQEFIANPLDTATARAWAKGPGNGVDSASQLGAAETAAVLTFGTGTLTSRTAFHTLGAQVAYALMRATEPGDEHPEQVAFQIRSYVGNGAAGVRDIALTTPASGKRPLFAIVVPANAQTIFRDPGHLTGTSSPFGAISGTIANGIVAGGIDFITVGTTLNANLINYSVLVIPGSTTAGTDGWSIDGEFLLKEPQMPGGSQWDVPVFTEADIDEAENPTAPGAAALVDEPDLDQLTVISNNSTDVGGLLGGQVCEVYTRAIVNRALGRIGWSKVASDLVADTSEQAVQARRYIKESVNAVLRDWPWPFATRYANLVLVAGSEATPVNNDWTFSYRAPNSMMFARRIAVAGIGRKSAVNQDAFLSAQAGPGMWPTVNSPRPITFRQATDSAGILIYCNVEATTDEPLVLEYTTRISCPAFFGDALFRDALAWRIAADLANPLARDAKRAAECLQMYYTVLPKAHVVAANEAQQEPNGDADWISGRN